MNEFPKTNWGFLVLTLACVVFWALVIVAIVLGLTAL